VTENFKIYKKKKFKKKIIYLIRIQMDTSLRLKTRTQKTCFFCDYTCFRSNDMKKHLSTDKHQKNAQGYKENTQNCDFVTENSQKSQKVARDHNLHHYLCECGKKYNYHSGLWKHKKICNYKINNAPETMQLLIDENNSLKNLILEICKNNTINNFTHITNNKTFNLNVFLNETCKDAMNIMDFVDSLKIQFSDLESVGKLGFVEGISNIIIKNLKALEFNKRPLHCSDPKREIIYIKDENKWEKENDDKNKLRKAIKYVAHKNSKMLPEFKAKYPDCIYSNSIKSDQYNKLIIETMGGPGNNDNEKENKIIKNIVKEVTINKLKQIN
jgi:hypothetical protein